MPIPTWFTQVIHLYPTFYGNFRAGFQYTFSFRPRIFRTGGTNRNVAIASVQLFAANDPTWVDSWKLDQPIFESNIRPTIFATGPNVTSFASPVSATLTSTVDRNRVRLIAQITLSAPVQDSVQNVEFLDIQLQRQSEAWVEPTLVSGASEKVTIPKMPSQLDPNPRTASDCPHLKAGLRHWHDASIWPGNTVPAPSSSITLPANMSVLISSCSLAAGDYNYIRIPQNSELIFADSPINLRVRSAFALLANFCITKRDRLTPLFDHQISLWKVNCLWDRPRAVSTPLSLLRLLATELPLTKSALEWEPRVSELLLLAPLMFTVTNSTQLGLV